MRAQIEIPDRLGAAALDAALEGLVQLGIAELGGSLQVGAEVPTLYTSGVRYNRNDPDERWQTPGQVMAAGAGDCEDLAAWRAAELRVSGVDPTARARVIRSGPRTWHAVVDREGGTYIEDPSSVLGMGAEDEGSIVGWSLDVSRVPGGYQATLIRDGQGVVGRGRLASTAIRRATAMGASVGQIPGLDLVARIARGALDAALPSTPQPQPQRTAPAPSIPRPVAPSLPALPGPTGDVAADVQRIARQISQITSREARRKLAAATTAAQRAVRGGRR